MDDWDPLQLLVGFILAMLGFMIHMPEELREDEAKAISAQKSYLKNLSNRKNDLVLLLRSFSETDTRLYHESPLGAKGQIFPFPVLDKFVGFEEDMFFVAMGTPLAGEHTLRKQVLFLSSQDDNWRDILQVLIEHSRIIVVFPEETDGLLFEVDYILNSEARNKSFIYVVGDLYQNIGAPTWDRVMSGLTKFGFNLERKETSRLISMRATKDGQQAEQVEFDKFVDWDELRGLVPKMDIGTTVLMDLLAKNINISHSIERIWTQASEPGSTSATAPLLSSSATPTPSPAHSTSPGDSGDRVAILLVTIGIPAIFFLASGLLVWWLR